MDDKLSRLRRAAADDPEAYSAYIRELLRAGKFQEVAFGHFADWRRHYNTARGKEELNALVAMVKEFLVHSNPAAAAIQVGVVHPYVLVLALQISHGENNVFFNVEKPSQIDMWDDPWGATFVIRQQSPWKTYAVEAIITDEDDNREIIVDPVAVLSDGDLVNAVYDILWEHNLI